MLNGHENQDELVQEKIAEQYQELLAKFLDTAAAYADMDRKERAGEREQQALKRKIEGFANSIEQIRAALTNTEHPASFSVADLIAGYAEATRRHTNVAKTPFPAFNKVLGGGLEAGTMIALLGAPGAGKTAMANHIADHVANQGRPVLYLTSETSPHVLLCNTIARLSQIHCTAVRKGHIDYLDRIQVGLTEYAERKSARWLRYVDVTASPYTWAAIEREAQAHFETGAPGTGLLVVDYLQKLARPYVPGEKDVRLAVSRFADLLRNVATRLNCCVLVLGSQGRVAVKNKSIDFDNILTSAKESGDIEYTADALAAILKPEQDDPSLEDGSLTRWLVVAKNRLGSLAQIQLNWKGVHQRFIETDGEDEE